jgi:hypothetical protein
MGMRITGQCHCGYVTYEAVIDPLAVGICHCTDCQRLTGSPFRVTARADRDALRLTGNPPNIYRKRGDNGRSASSTSARDAARRFSRQVRGRMRMSGAFAGCPA